MTEITAWTPGNGRIWWACPTCKLEAGITLPTSAVEMAERLHKFIEQHKDCTSKEATWQRSA